MELTIALTREDYEAMTTALVNAELDAWDRGRKARTLEACIQGRKDEEACYNLRLRLEHAFDNIAPWCAERRDKR